MGNPLSPMALLDALLGALGRAADGDEPRGPEDGPPSDHEQREAAQVVAMSPPTLNPGENRLVIDVQDQAARAKYADGRVKRTAYPPVDLAARKIVIVGHQAGFTWKPTNSKHANLTGHRVIRVDAALLVLHPLHTRLVEANRFDRAPWHGIGIEVITNAEGQDGTGNWYRPDLFGKGRATDAQVDAVRICVGMIVTELDNAGLKVYGVAPHIVSGRDSKGRPNRTIDPGSRLWGEGYEWAAAEYGLRVPGPGWKLGGAPIPDKWRGPRFAECARFA